MVKPSAVGGLGITLPREPAPSILATLSGMRLVLPVEAVVRGPVGDACISALVAYPSGLTTQSPHEAMGQHGMHGVAQVVEVIIDGTVHLHHLPSASIIPIAPVGTIKPHLKLVLAVGGTLQTLAQEHVGHILGCAVESTIPVPRTDVEAVLHAQPSGSTGKVAGDVGLASLLAGAGQDRVGGGGCGPQTESIVMLHHGYSTTHTSLAGHPEPLSGIGHRGGGKQVLILVTQPPLPTGVSIHTVMEEGIELGLAPGQLGGRGEGVHR